MLVPKTVQESQEHEDINNFKVDPINEDDFKISIEEAKKDISFIREASKYFEEVLATRRRVDCSDYVPTSLRRLVELFNNSRFSTEALRLNNGSSAAPIISNLTNSSASSSNRNHPEVENELIDWSQVKPMDANTRRMLQNPLYAKMLRPVVQECMRTATNSNDQQHPPVGNPFAPVPLSVTFGAIKLKDLSFDGTLVMFVQLTLKWNDFRWRWSTSTRCASAQLCSYKSQWGAI